MGINNI